MNKVKKNILKSVVPVIAAVSIAIPVTNQVMPSFIDTPAIIMEADAAYSAKRSGKSKAYVSSLFPGRMSFTICLNTDKDIATMIAKLEIMSYWTSGCKNGATVLSFGEFFVKDPASKLVLLKASKVFMDGYGVSKSAGKAAKSLKSLAYNKKNLKKGVKITMCQKGDWLVQLQ
ncbi:MAG: hypothetical protein K2O60_04995 [Ruminococcus sp.]|nr:hypothetical protein [Ruminococcus sp.]